MESPAHDLKALFSQLGLDGSEAGIEHFIAAHTPLPDDVALHQAAFWNASQSAFLCEAIRDDADWADSVEQLNLMLRH